MTINQSSTRMLLLTIMSWSLICCKSALEEIDPFATIFLLPKSNTMQLCMMEGVTTTEIGALNFPSDAKTEISRHGWIAGVAYRNEEHHWLKYDSIFVAKLDTNYQVIENTVIPLDSGDKVYCFDVNENYLYVGGQSTDKLNRSKGQFAFRVDLSDHQFHKVPIDLPQSVMHKGIDDFLFLEHSTILVDNILIPKYLIEYTNIGEVLQYRRTHELKVNGVNEVIRKAIHNSDVIVLWSEATSRIGISTFLSILDKSSFKEINKLEFHASFSKSAKAIRIRDIEFAFDQVYILFDNDELCIWDMAGSFSYFELQQLKDSRDIVRIENGFVIVSNRKEFEILKTY